MPPSLLYGLQTFRTEFSSRKSNLRLLSVSWWELRPKFGYLDKTKNLDSGFHFWLEKKNDFGIFLCR